DRVRRAVAAARRWPMSRRWVAGGAAAAALLVLGVVALSGGEEPAAPPARIQQPVAAGAELATQRFDGRGVSVEVPQGWKRRSAGNWVDFTDPADPQRRIRILVEPARAEPLRFMEIAESGLRRATSCTPPYARVDLRPATQGDREAADLEYTCGRGGQMRHGVWRAVTDGTRAYSFYLSTPEPRFAESREIFARMARTFRVA
ncbi:MAG TPA: serine/threonine protein kinase, partial [Pilimelia sp.]|nr:serine/threonine protein kinase [Pilimelia sp.]